jgi:hypothetical protein
MAIQWLVAGLILVLIQWGDAGRLAPTPVVAHADLSPLFAEARQTQGASRPASPHWIRTRMRPATSHWMAMSGRAVPCIHGTAVCASLLRGHPR